MPFTPERRAYLDWLRGIGVLIMIEAHTLDSWTRLADRNRPSYRWALVLGGFGAPIFLFLAGVALALAANARVRRGMHEVEAAARARRRAWQVFALAFLFRLQSVIISGGGMRAFLKVDILNIMGVSMLAAAVLWQLGRTTHGRVLLLVTATVLTALLTPPIRSSALLDWLPDAVEGYIRPGGRSTFTIFPWSGFLFGGVLAGMWLDVTDRRDEARRNAWLLATGILVAAAGYATSFLPPVYAQSNYWTSSPTFFFVRLGIIAALIPMAFGWLALFRRAKGAFTRSPVRELGVASLFVYWIHVEMVYGVLSTPLHRALSFEAAALAMVVFSLFLFSLVRFKDRLVMRRIAAKSTTFPPVRPMTPSKPPTSG